MLDFTKLSRQINDVSIDAIKEIAYAEAAEQAELTFDQVRQAPEQFTERLKFSQPWVLWPVAIPLEPFGTTHELVKSPAQLTVVGVDGSQILPSQHEVHSCYVLNTGLVLITYGERFPPIMESTPHLFHRSEDLYPLIDRRRIHIDELFVSLERAVLELETVAAYAIHATERNHPVVAMFDGSLIPFSLEKMPEGYQDHFISRMESSLTMLREAEIPLVGYISHSRSSDVVNMLRTNVCPYDTPDCRSHCGLLNEEEFPCSRIWPLLDRHLFRRLPAGHRSSICRSSSMASKGYSTDNQICFTYINTGFEVARVEFPQWMLPGSRTLEVALATVFNQAAKGKGYPIVLSEAHHLAVITKIDRERFFDMIGRHLVGIGVSRVETSPKETKKRAGFV